MTRALVFKVGGSLLDLPDLPRRLSDHLIERAATRPVLIVGGGRAADVVRELDRLHRLGPGRAHALALRALDLTAHALAAMLPGLDVVEELGTLEEVWSAGRVPVLAPRRPLDEDDRISTVPLTRSWDVTTDAIAARLAIRLGARELALLKSAPAPEGLDREGAARLGLVDRAFLAEARPLPRVTYRNLRDPEGRTVVLG